VLTAKRLLDTTQREGFGIIIFADGTRYNGAFAGGLCNGLGVLTFSGEQTPYSSALEFSSPATTTCTNKCGNKIGMYITIMVSYI
jgi:hypothetical protein